MSEPAHPMVLSLLMMHYDTILSTPLDKTIPYSVKPELSCVMLQLVFCTTYFDIVKSS